MSDGIVTVTGLAASSEIGKTGDMKPPPDPRYRHRFPVEIISHAVWLYHVFSLSLRDVELLLAERGVVVSYETVRRWCKKFGQSFASHLRRRRPQPGDKWYMDEVFIRIRGVQHYLWRAVDQDGVVLDILVQERRDGKAAKRFFRRLLKGLEYVPRVIVTDKLRSYGVAQRHLLPDVEHRQSRYLNNRAENSHRPTRRRERQMQRFKSSEQAQGFLFAHAFIQGHFRPRRHLLAAHAYRAIRSEAFDVWHQETCDQHVT
jgi:putative transposase